MNKNLYSILVVFLSFIGINTLVSQTPTASFAIWKDNKKAAYTIIHDDYSDYVPGIFGKAYPIAQARGVKICFGAITGFCGATEWANARTMIANGHECVNHSHNHKCGGSAGQCTGLTTYGAADFNTELNQSTTLIQTNTGVKPLFFIHPYDASSDAILNHLQGTLGYLGARSGSQGVVNANTFTDFMRENYFVYDGTAASLSSLNTAVNTAISSGGYAIREFHGVEDGSWAAMTVPNYTSHLDYVKSKMDDGSLWSATASEAITYKMQRDAYQPVATYTAATNTVTVSFNALKTINTAILRTPITVNVNLNGIAGNYDVTQGGAAVAASRVGNIITFNVYPYNGAVTLRCNNCVVTPPTPSNVSNLLAVTQTNAILLNWTNPTSNFDEVMIVAKPISSVLVAPNGTAYTADANFSGVGSAFDGGKVIYKGTGSIVNVTNLSGGTRYYFKAFSRLGTTWSSGIEVSAVPNSVVVPPTTPLNISNLTATAQTNAVLLGWANPTTNFEEVMIVAKPSVSVIAAPSGTSYTADASYTGAGTAFDGGKVVYKGTGSSITVTNLTAGTRYYFKAFSRVGTTWSSGVEVSAVPTSTVVVTPVPGCLQASYFSNNNLTGTPVKVQGEAKIDYNWATAAPLTGVPADNFSIRWEGTVNPTVTGSYVFTATADDGVRLWVNNQLVIDKWIDQGTTSYSATVSLTQGQAAPIKMEYYEKTGSALARLAWTIPSQTSAIIAFNATCTVVQPPVAAFDATKCYRIDARHSNRPLQLVSRATTDGVRIEQGSWSNSRTEMWRIKSIDGTYYHLTNAYSGKYVTVASSATTDGANMIQNTLSANATNQMFKFDKNASGYYVITAKHSNKVFNILGSSTLSGANLVQWTSNNGNNQQFTISTVTCPSNAAALESNKVIVFNGQLDNAKAVLQWGVQSEDLTDYYELEKADEQGDFKRIALINGNSSSEIRTFSHTDDNLFDGDNYYRLKSTDTDGKTQLSDIITIKYNRPDSYAVFPNPAQDFMTIDLSSLNGQPVDISVVTPLGQVVKSVHLDNPSVSHRIELDDVQNGNYLLRIDSKGRKSVMKKMIVIK